MTSIMDITLDSPFPNGSWTLYFHAQDENKWGLNTFTKISTITCWREFWSVLEAIGNDSISDGMFFFMRDPIPPLWENHQNVRGGVYSIRVQKQHATETYISYTIACILGKLTTNPDNIINGVSVSPKKNFNIIKVWNTDSTMHNTPSDLQSLTASSKAEEVLYTPFVQKKM